jgi:tartrate/fumarate subfamily iron-sulfur-dependent hydro-lyase beta chain
MERVLRTPIRESEARSLCVGETIFVSGLVFTARDEAHRTLLEAADRGVPLPEDLEGMALFHCGPVVRQESGEWRVVSAGPTTSARMEGLEAEFLERFRPRLIIGKGGMGTRTLGALGRVGAVYTHFTGGAGALGARAVRRVVGVYGLEELGMTEAIWIFDVERFGPLLVTMDTGGRSLYHELKATVEENVRVLHARMEEG